MQESSTTGEEVCLTPNYKKKHGQLHFGGPLRHPALRCKSLNLRRECNTGMEHHPNFGWCRRRSLVRSSSLPQARILGEEGDVPHLVLPEVGRQALLPVLPDVDGAREEVLVDGYDGRGLVAAPLVAAPIGL